MVKVSDVYMDTDQFKDAFIPWSVICDNAQLFRPPCLVIIQQLLLPISVLPFGGRRLAGKGLGQLGSDLVAERNRERGGRGSVVFCLASVITGNAAVNSPSFLIRSRYRGIRWREGRVYQESESAIGKDTRLQDPSTT